MIRSLIIENVAIIDRLELELGPGLTVLTGETGAGKSIIINSLDLLLGGRGSAEMIRTGADEALVEAEVDGPELEALEPLLQQAGIEPERPLIVRRQLNAAGRSRAVVGGRSVPISVLRELGRRLVAIYGQHEHQTLLDEARHGALLDEFGGLTAQIEAVAAAFAETRELTAQAAELRRREREAGARQDYLRFLVSELQSAGLAPDEEQELQSRRRVLANAARLALSADEACRCLTGEQGGAQEAVARAAHALREAARIDERLAGVAEQAETALLHVEEAARSIEAYAAGITHDPEELERIEARLDRLAGLKRKYRVDLAGLIALLESSRAEIEAIQTVDQRLAQVERELAAARERLRATAAALSAARRKAAARLARDTERELAELSMPRTRFVVRVDPRPGGNGGPGDLGDVGVDERGADNVAFHISPNPGEEPRPLSRIASGGELSRIMLALRQILQRAEPVPTMIFDEVDSGIGGQTAAVVGAKLAAVARGHQVLVITHLPQIARFGDGHFSVRKTLINGRTATRLERLDQAGRVEEIARLIGGEPVSANARAAAAELLDSKS